MAVYERPERPPKSESSMTIDELSMLAQDNIAKYNRSQRLQELLSFNEAIDDSIFTSSYGEIEIVASSINGSKRKILFGKNEAILMANVVKKAIISIAREIGEELKG